MPLPERPLPDTGDDDASLPGLPVRFGISALVMAGMILLAVVLVSVGWWGARQVLLDMAERSAEDAGRKAMESLCQRPGLRNCRAPARAGSAMHVMGKPREFHPLLAGCAER